MNTQGFEQRLGCVTKDRFENNSYMDQSLRMWKVDLDAELLNDVSLSLWQRETEQGNIQTTAMKCFW